LWTRALLHATGRVANCPPTDARPPGGGDSTCGIMARWPSAFTSRRRGPGQSGPRGLDRGQHLPDRGKGATLPLSPRAHVATPRPPGHTDARTARERHTGKQRDAGGASTCRIAARRRMPTGWHIGHDGATDGCSETRWAVLTRFGQTSGSVPVLQDGGVNLYNLSGRIASLPAGSCFLSCPIWFSSDTANRS